MSGQRSLLRATAPALAVFLLGCLLSWVGAQWLSQRIDQQAQLDFQRISADTGAEVIQRFRQPVYGLNGMRGLFAASEQVNRAELRTYIESRDLRDEYSGVRGFGLIKPVLRKDLKAFVASEQADGAPEFAIHALTNQALDDLLVVTSIEPAGSNVGALGLDIGSEATRRAGAQQARDTGVPTLTGAIELVQAQRKTPGFLLYLPIYAHGASLGLIEERRSALLGWVYATLQIDELLNQLPDVEADLLRLELYDSSLGRAEGTLLYRTEPSDANPAPSRPLFSNGRALALPGRTLSLNVQSTPHFEASIDHTAPWLLGGSGTLISLMLALLLHQQIRGRRRAEQLAQDMTADLTRLAQVAKHTSNAVWIADPQGHITWVNEGFSRMTGYSAEEAIGKKAGALVSSGKADASTLRTLADTLTYGGSCRVEILNRAKDGREYWTDIELQAQRDANGGLTGFMEIGTDITQLRQRKAEAIRHWELLRGSIDALDEAFVLFDPQDRLVLCNDKYKQVYQAMAHLLVPGALFEDIIRAYAEMGHYAVAMEQVEEWVKERLAAHRSGNSDLIQRHRNGTTLRIVERKLPDGHTVGFRIDITQLVNATDAAQAASTAKSQFLANMSHEIRTPMNAILGMLTLLRKTKLSARQSDYAVKSESAALALLGLINDILDFSKIEAGKMTLDPQPFEWEQVLNNLSVILSTSTGCKSVDLLFDVDGTLPTPLVGDAMRLQQVLLNLCGNALKFTEQGEVVLAVQVTQQHHDTVTLRVSVRDTGIGIAPAHQARIFSGFTQAEASTTRRFGGTGLGVAISQRLVSLMGGELQLQSELGQGSCFFFTITLPVGDPRSINHKPRGLTPSTPPRVLIIDDHPTARDVLQRTCQSLGWTADTCDAGADAWAALQTKSAHGAPYDAIFVDGSRPSQGSWSRVQDLRQSEGGAKTRVIAMVTHQGREMLLKQSESDPALLDDLLVKPITASLLWDSLMQTHHVGTKAPPVTPLVNAPRLQEMRLLVVEDNLNNQQVARELLQGEGALVRVANNGQAGVKAIANAKPPFDVVLMDLQMPVMDGFEATRVIREEMGLRTLPIVAMTANALTSDRAACLAAGMNEHLGKPFDLDTLVGLLRHQAGWPALVVAKRTTQGAALPEPVWHAATTAQVDLEAALHRLGGNPAVYQKLLSAFVRDVRTMPDQLKAHLAQGQVPESSRLLHTLKGLAATMGALPLATQATLAEKRLACATGSADCSAAIDPLCAAIHALVPGLEALLSTLQWGDPSTAGSTVTSVTPADTHALQVSLRTLALHLKNSDMAALQSMADLQQRYGNTLGEPLAPLRAAMDRLDFASALPLCEALMTPPTA